MTDSRSNRNDGVSANMLVALRRVMRAVDLHSRRLVRSHGLTGPQAVLIGEVIASQGLTAGDLARRVNLSQATVTDIVKRLEARGLLSRRRDIHDKRRVLISTTRAGQTIYASAPPLLQQTFVERFESLPDWEQSLLLSAMQRIAALMDAEGLEAAALLSSEEFVTARDFDDGAPLPGDVAG